MLIPHTIVGAAIAVSISNPLIAAPLSFAMHLLGDRVPHWDFYAFTKREERLVGWRPLGVMADLGIGIAIGVALTLYCLWVLNKPALAFNVFVCGIASVLPDVLCGPVIYSGEKAPWILRMLGRLQSKMQFQEHMPWGLVTQIIVCVVAGLIFYIKS